MSQQQPMVPVPFNPYGQPFFPQMVERAAEPPARVKAALEFLTGLSLKTMVRAAINDISIEHIPGQTLTVPETYAQSAACNMLTSYFKGEMEPDVFESLAYHDRYPDEPGPGEDSQVGRVLDCPPCKATPRKDCELCKGTGRIIVFPAGKGE